jgi:aspartyl-tRNA(Asn)/glutamyl-tRNA(Gln) amidotransferase subunit A
MSESGATYPADLGLLEAAALLRSRALSAVELLEACQARIAARNGGAPTFDGAPGAINAWTRLYPELAGQLARAADARLATEGDAAPVTCGIPFALKDLFAVAGLGLTASSRVLEGSVAAADSAVWRRLRAHGAVLAGHTHTHEFAAGGTTDQVANPWAPDRIAGGSSGGSAAALAARMVPAAVGTDTAGSLRIPAALSGVSSIKPTYGRVPDDGCIPLSPTLDHPGPMARSVADASALLVALATEPGVDAGPVVAALPLHPRERTRPLEGLRVAVTGRPEAAHAEADVLEGLQAARTAAERLGARVAELAAHVERRDRYRASIREFVDLAEELHDPAAYEAAQGRRAEMTARWRAWFAGHEVDLLLEATVPLTAFARGHGYDSGNLGGEGDPLIVLTSTWNFTGFPVVALPAGLGARSGLPVGVSLIGPPDSEPLLIQAAIDLQAHELPPLDLDARR